jgi:hypothetical protein
VKRNAFAPMLFGPVTIAIGFLCICSLPAFAAEDSSQTNPAVVTNPPSPPPPGAEDSSQTNPAVVTNPPSPPPASRALSSGISQPNPIAFDPSMHLTPEE